MTTNEIHTKIQEGYDDMKGIYNYIAVQLSAPDAANDQYNRIAYAIEKLGVFSQRIKVMESEPEHSIELRQLTIDNYSVFYVIYVIKYELVIVLRVLYGASDIGTRLLDY